MSDFFITFDPSSSEKRLLELLKGRYPRDFKIGGGAYKTSWGVIAVLDNVFEGYGPVLDAEALFFPLGRPRLLETAGGTDIFRGNSDGGDETNRRSWKIFNFFKKMELNRWANTLNGEFCLVFANRNRPKIMIVTDPINAVRVYVGIDKRGIMCSIGTQPDLIAHLADRVEDVDLASAADVLLNGRITSLYSLYKGIDMLPPASISTFDLDRSKTAAIGVKPYWQPLRSQTGQFSRKDLSERLQTAIQDAVRDAVEGREHIGVLLSGGLDSRVVLAAIPKDRDRTALTVCDAPNLETDIASKVADSLRARWILLRRDNEYYGNIAFDAIRLSAGDPIFLDAHFLGFREKILGERLDIILGGYLADTLFKGYYCSEPITLFNRSLPRSRVKKPVNAEHWIADQRARNYANASWALRKNVLEELQERHLDHFREIEKIREDGSAAEWIEFWSCTKGDIPNLSVHRRIFPKTEIFLDKRILEVATVVPQSLKVNAALFRKAVLPILGEVARIQLSSTRVSVSTPVPLQFLSGVMQKGSAKVRRALNAERAKSLLTDGSWPNREWYWRNSKVIKDWMDHFTLDTPVFLRELLDTPIESIFSSQTPVFFKYRLLHLCIWDLARRVER